MDDSGERRLAVIIEDDPDIRGLLETVLSQAGFETVSADNGLDGVSAVRQYDPVVTTLDVSLPGIDGFEAAKRIRSFSETYIVMLTARDEEIDALQGLESGADDYVTKPFRPRELRARIEAMLRRPRRTGGDSGSTGPMQVRGSAPAASATGDSAFAGGSPASVAGPASYAGATQTGPVRAVPTHSGVPHGVPMHAGSAPSVPSVPAALPEEGWMEHNGLRVNAEMRIAEVDGVELELTRSEFDLVTALMDSRRRVRSKADLALRLRGEDYVTTYYVNDADKRAVEVHMANLRRKLGDNTAAPRFIETVRGVGYRLAAVGS
jgi:DNA-binding response OmpR family regulator